MTLVDRSSDLSKLRNEGYDIEIRDGNLLVHHVPFLTSDQQVAYGVLVSELTTNGDQTVRPGGHDAWMVGGVPHDHTGKELKIVIGKDARDFGPGLTGSCRLSGKPGGKHPENYHIKMANYVKVLGSFARAVEPSATHEDFPAREVSEEESVFCYHDAASSRSGLTAVTKKLELDRVAIVGLGGTGSYILDQVAKTPVKEIHLFDDDELLAHNAFRAPGAASLDDVRPQPKKVDYLSSMYAPFRRNIVPHDVKVTEDNVGDLAAMDFVFVSMDAGPDKKAVFDFLHQNGIPFVDCGIGLTRVENSLRGSVRTTTGSPGHYDHIESRVSFNDVNDDEYNLNMQTADLNMLNAALAIIRWKKHYGYYMDTRGEMNSVYAVASSRLTNGEELE